MTDKDTSLAQDTLASRQENQELAGKYLTFILNGEEYGLEILKVREIIGMMDITAVPRTPDYIKGVINLRGKVIPVINLRLKFGFETQEATDQTCIIVVDIGNLEMGIVVDEVSEVLDIQASAIEKTPSFGVSVNTDFILGMGKSEQGVKILLDITAVLSDSQLDKISDMVEDE